MSTGARRATSTTATVLAALGGLTVVVASPLAWVGEIDGRMALAPSEAAAASLPRMAYEPVALFSQSVGMVLLVAGALTTVGAVAGSRAMTVLFAAVTLASALGWLRVTGGVYDQVGLGALSFAGWVGVGGAAVALVCAFDVRRDDRGVGAAHRRGLSAS